MYLPYQCPDNYDFYVEYLGKISATIEDCHCSKIAIIGDFNAAVGTTFADELLELCTKHELIISDYDKDCVRLISLFMLAMLIVPHLGWITLYVVSIFVH